MQGGTSHICAGLGLSHATESHQGIFSFCELLIFTVSITTMVNGLIQNKEFKDSEANVNDHLRLEVSWKVPSTFAQWSKAFWLR